MLFHSKTIWIANHGEFKMHRYTLLKILLIPFLFCIAFLAYADNSYNKVYIFGDSLSDTGNLGSVIGGIPDPYFKNRISNGPVAVETLAAKFGDTANASLHLLGLNAGHNYSVAGAKASTNEAIDLNTQILSFQANHASIAPSDALYVIFIGGNDIRYAAGEFDDVIANSILQIANNNVKNAITLLKQMGARSFLVVNAPNIALLPETRLIASAINNPAYLKRAALLSRKYNVILHDIVDNLEDDETEITEFNLFKLFAKTIKKASKLGITNTTEACFRSRIPDFHPDCNFGLNADHFYFFDEIHPTTQIHTLFGKAFAKSVIDDDHDEKDDDDENEENGDD